MRGNRERRRLEPLYSLRYMDRRTFVKMGGLSAAALLVGAGPYAAGIVERPRFASYPFSLGVASGDPLPDGMLLWTRLAPDPLNGGGMPDQEVPVRWQVAEDEGFKRVVQTGTEYARIELAHSVHAEVEGLEPGREYFYRFKAGSEISPVGRTKTAPAAGTSVAEMNFAFASCQQYEHGYFTAYRRMSEEDLDLIVHLGDYIYEYGPGEFDAPGGNARIHNSHQVFMLFEYRNRYALYRMDEDLQASHAAFPWIVTCDDHEAQNNYAGETPENGPPGIFTWRRAAAYQAYYEHMPLRSASTPSGPDMLLYRRLAYGDLVEFNVLDTRQYRDDQANGDGIKPLSLESTTPERTLMGDEQERWLLDGLADSGARWNVLAQQIFFARRGYRDRLGQRFDMNAWDGYSGSRDRVVESIAERGVNVHANWANEILRDFDDPGSSPVGVEFVGTAITSGGDGSDTDAAAAAVMAENPHIKFYNDRRGYVRCRVTPDAWQADYRILPYVKQPGAPVSTAASFVVEDGNPRLQLASEEPEAANTRVSQPPEIVRLLRRTYARTI
jgi:alkaline phosphatase D